MLLEGGREMKRSILITLGIFAALLFTAADGSNALAATKGKPVRLGYLAPLSGTYADIGNSEVEGAKLAVEEVNASGGILGRPVKLFVEDTEAKTDVGTQKIRKLIEKNKVNFTFGSVSSGVSLALAQVARENNILHIVTGGHSDSITGKDCNWNVFRIPTTTMMQARSIGKFLADKFGKRWYIMTPDYAYGWSLQAGFEDVNKQLGGTIVGADRIPLGATDFSATLVKVGAAKPDVLLVLQAGHDAVNAMKQIVQFGLNKQMAIAGGLNEWEGVHALPTEARLGWWTFEWYYNQQDVPAAKVFSDKILKHYHHVATARNWFGYLAIETVAHIANQEKTLDAVKLAKALEGWTVPPDIAMEPNKVYYRAGDHELMGSVYVGEVRQNTTQSDSDLFHVTRVVPGDEAALPVSECGCTIKFPGQ
jgi:branched-chain amino acid transport system substrate-binding protein